MLDKVVLVLMLKTIATTMLLIGILFCNAIYPDAKDSSITIQKMKNHSPEALSQNRYFYNGKDISYAIIYSSANDSLYFISKKISLDSTEYALVFTSSNRIIGYQFINFRNSKGDTLFAIGKIHLTENRTLIFSILYFPLNFSIKSSVYKAKKLSTFKSDSTFNFVQNNNVRFNFGLRYELVYMNNNVYNSNENSLENNAEFDAFPPNLDLFLGFSILDRYKASFRFGLSYLFEEDLSFYTGMFLESRIFETNFYGNIGVNFLGIGGGGHGISDNQNFVGNISFLGLGIGYEVSKQFGIDLSYYLPFNKVYGTDIINSYPVTHIYDKKINTFINLGLQYSIFY
jgi:hypothetical protein